MDITKRLLELDPSLARHNEGFWDEPYDPARLGSYSSFNDAGIEIETGEFMYGLTRILKPTHILETGTHWGIGAAYMGSALKDNGIGHLDTVEFLQEIHNRAKQRMATLTLEDYVTCHLGDVANFEPSVAYQLILLDTEPQTRFAELVKFYNFLSPGGFVFIHDLHRHMHQIPNEEHGFAWPYGPIPQTMKELVMRDELRPFHFPTPRGYTGFYKVDKANDYKWHDQ